MVLKVKGMSVNEFRKGAGFFYPYDSKILYRNGKPIARYSAKTKRVSII